jgi:hypothetical protein
MSLAEVPTGVVVALQELSRASTTGQFERVSRDIMFILASVDTAKPVSIEAV